jgi:antitoxin (DNA-binding transcriptional repressor) of toxin-antitoxin stability system
MFAKQIDVQENQSSLEELVAMAQQGGEIILMQGDTPVARLTPVENAKKKQRIPNLHPGGWISDDFTDPLPDEFWLGTDK